MHRTSVRLSLATALLLACTPPDAIETAHPSLVSDPAIGMEVDWQSPVAVPIEQTPVIKPGADLDLVGRANGSGFRGFRIEWAPGRAPMDGWSTAGIALTSDGRLPVVDGPLGRWTLPAGVRGDYSLRLTAWNDLGSVAEIAVVHLEPDLLTGNWPQPVGPTSASGLTTGAAHAPLPARAADGQTWFLICAYYSENGSTCRSTRADGGAFRTFAVSLGTLSPPSAGDVDGQPGDELVIPDDQVIHILRPDLTLVRDIPIPNTQTLKDHETILADLDNDGVMEIIALAFNFGWGGTLHVYRGNGQSFAPRFPLLLDRPEMPDGFIRLEAVAVDLDGDRRKEILVLMVDANTTRYLLPAFTATGEPVAGWNPPSFPLDNFAGELKAADLDRDGRPEITLFEYVGGIQQLRVLDNRGVTRPGFPVVGASFAQAIGDLDGDGRDEIITRGDHEFFVLRADGTRFGPATWPVAPFHGPALIADVTGDAAPEIVVSDTRFDGSAEPVTQLKAIDRAGNIVRRWSLYGVEDRPAQAGTASIGDFNSDGRNDIAVHFPLSGSDRGGLTVFGTSIIGGSLDWPLPYADAQNSSVRFASAPPTQNITLTPVADAYVRDGLLARMNFGREANLAVKRSQLPGLNHVSYVRFSLAGVPANVSGAKLRLYGKRVLPSPVTDSAFAVDDNSWTERGLTWRNSPALGARQGAPQTVGTTAGYVEWDVTAFVRSHKAAGAVAVSLAVRMDAPVAATLDVFNSREADANRPQLVVTGR